MSKFTQIEVLDRGPARIVRFARPEALNALTDTMVLETREAMAAVEIDRSVAAVILTGDDRAFCAGGDLKESASDPRPAFDKYLHRFNQSVWQGFARYLAHYPKPAIAAVEGHCLGGGLELALLCDFILCSETARFGLPEARISLFPILGGAWSLSRTIGERRARELIYTGRRIDARTAQSIGLVNHVEPAGGALARAVEIAEEIAQSGPLAVAMAKQAVDRSARQTVDEALAAAGEFSGLLHFSEDRQEGLRAFREKRTPEFKGK